MLESCTHTLLDLDLFSWFTHISVYVFGIFLSQPIMEYSSICLLTNKVLLQLLPLTSYDN